MAPKTSNISSKWEIFSPHVSLNGGGDGQAAKLINKLKHVMARSNNFEESAFVMKLLKLSENKTNNLRKSQKLLDAISCGIVTEFGGKQSGTVFLKLFIAFAPWLQSTYLS